jgi:hypothetical protein
MYVVLQIDIHGSPLQICLTLFREHQTLSYFYQPHFSPSSHTSFALTLCSFRDPGHFLAALFDLSDPIYPWPAFSPVLLPYSQQTFLKPRFFLASALSPLNSMCDPVYGQPLDAVVLSEPRCPSQEQLLAQFSMLKDTHEVMSIGLKLGVFRIRSQKGQ